MGSAEIAGFYNAWRRWLDTELDDWTFTDPHDQALLDQAMDNIAQKLLTEQDNREILVG